MDAGLAVASGGKVGGGSWDGGGGGGGTTSGMGVEREKGGNENRNVLLLSRLY